MYVETNKVKSLTDIVERLSSITLASSTMVLITERLYSDVARVSRKLDGKFKFMDKTAHNIVESVRVCETDVYVTKLSAVERLPMYCIVGFRAQHSKMVREFSTEKSTELLVIFDY